MKINQNALDWLNAHIHMLHELHIRHPWQEAALTHLQCIQHTLKQQEEADMARQNNNEKIEVLVFDHAKWERELAEIRADIARIKHMGGPAFPPIAQPPVARLPSPSEMSNALLWVKARTRSTQRDLARELDSTTAEDDTGLVYDLEYILKSLGVIEKVLQACIAQAQKSPDSGGDCQG